MSTRIAIALLCFHLLYSAPNASAQNNTNTSGGEASGVNGKVSYSIGQTGYQSSTDGSVTIAQGVQQPFEISTLTGVEKTEIQLSASVYPNPTSDFVTLRFAESDVQHMYILVLDEKGKQLSQQSVAKSQTDIPMSGYASGTYFIKVLDGKTAVKIFKIIKTS